MRGVIPGRAEGASPESIASNVGISGFRLCGSRRGRIDRGAASVGE
jgi:hypothetical protein